MSKISSSIIQALRLGLIATAPALFIAGASAPTARAQNTAGNDMSAMKDMGAMPEAPLPGAPPVEADQATMAGMAMPGKSDDLNSDAAMTMPMTGAFGPYVMAREASGTSWQPDSTPQRGIVFMAGDWMLMAHGYADLIYDNQGGPRGNDKSFSASMAMLMAQRPIGDAGTLGLRTMLSLDPAMGANGYPLLFATGETANGRDALVDRQHPHDMFMELSASYSYRLSDSSSAFIYAGLPGEPALGPPAFMHRLSGLDNPEAPITHHWMDSTHVTFGVVTAGYVQGPWKIEGSLFRGREPDQHRYDIEAPKLDSVAARLSYNPTPNWSLQASWGYLKSPEQLTPEVNENRATASATYNRPFGDNIWATTFAWGRKMNHPGNTLDGFLLESAVILDDTHTFFGRIERVAEDELFEQPSPLQGRIFSVNKISLGYIRDLKLDDTVKLGIGGLVSRYDFPRALDRAYGDPTSFMIFIRLKVG